MCLKPLYEGYTVDMVFTITRRQVVLLGLLSLLVVCLAVVPQTVFAVGIGEGITKVVNAVVGGLMRALEWILGLFQFLFLQVIEFTILNFADNWNEGGFLSDFRVVWQVLRDFVNLVIVVFFVITAMMTSLGDGQFGFHRKTLLYLILAAVFVNFSAFFTLLIIDISHILFMLFFNALDASSWGSFSPFSGYSVVLGDVATGMFNLIVGVIAIVVNWFILLGILYFCIILIERYIIAMFLVLLSPLAALGFFASLSGGNPLASRFVGVYTQWKERLGYVFSMPVVLILGFTLLLVLFRGALSNLVDPENFVKLIGVGSAEGRQILLQLIMASIVLILGMFKVGEVAKKANIHSAVAGKFKFGEIASKLVGGKAQLGLLRSLKNPAGRGIGNYKQRIYNKRDQWRKEGSVLAKIPGVGKSLDVGGKVRRTRQAARTIVKGVDAVAGGTSARDVAWQSAEATEDKRVWNIIRAGTRDQKQDLLKQALNPKSKVALNEQQTAELARNDALHPLLASLNKGVSQGTFRQIFSDAQKKGKEVVAEERAIEAEKDAFSDEYVAKKKGIDAAVADFSEVQLSYQDLGDQKDIAQKAYDDEKEQFDAAYSQAKSDFEQTDVYKEFQDRMREHQRTIEFHEKGGSVDQADKARDAMKKYEEEFHKNNGPASPDDSALQEKETALKGVKDEWRRAGEEKARLNKVKNEAGAAFRIERDSHKREVKSKKEENVEKQKAVAQILSDLATNAGAGSVSGSAAMIFSSDELQKAQEERQQMTAGTQKMFASVGNDYAKSSSVVKDMLAAEQGALKEQRAKENAELAEKKSAYYEEEARENKKNPNRDPAVLTLAMQQLKGEIETLEKSAADRRARSQEIDTVQNRIKNIRSDLADRDATDAQKIEILSQATSHAASFMQDGTQYLADQLTSVTQKIADFETQAQSDGANLDNSAEYQTLIEEKDLLDRHSTSMSTISQRIASVEGSLDEQRRIINSPAYKKVLDREQYLTALNVKTLLKDVSDALRKRKKEFEDEYKNKNNGKMPSKNAYKDDPEWKALDQWKKNMEKVQKEGGASVERQQKEKEEAQKV